MANLKKLFFGALTAHFRKPANMRRLATVFLGSACEQWINGECFQACHAFSPTLWVRPERHKGDLMIFRDDGAPEPDVVLETKVLYSSEATSVQRAKLAVLHGQLGRWVRQFPDATVVGVVVTFSWKWRDRRRDDGWVTPRAHVLQPGLLPRRERLAVGFANAFGHTGGARLLREHEIRFGSYQYRIGAGLELLRAI